MGCVQQDFVMLTAIFKMDGNDKKDRPMQPSGKSRIVWIEQTRTEGATVERHLRERPDAL